MLYSVKNERRSLAKYICSLLLSRLCSTEFYTNYCFVLLGVAIIYDDKTILEKHVVRPGVWSYLEGQSIHMDLEQFGSKSLFCQHYSSRTPVFRIIFKIFSFWSRFSLHLGSLAVFGRALWNKTLIYYTMKFVQLIQHNESNKCFANAIAVIVVYHIPSCLYVPSSFISVILFVRWTTNW